MKFEFQVGESEYHIVQFHFNKLWGNLKITVDNKKVISDFRMFSVSPVINYDFNVGISEVHNVQIQKIRPLAFGGVRTNTYKVFVDGHLQHEYVD